MQIEARLEALGLVLPAPFQSPPGLAFPFLWVRVRGNRAYIAGHGPEAPDGSIAGPFGKVGSDVTIEQAYDSARLVALAMQNSNMRKSYSR